MALDEGDNPVVRGEGLGSEDPMIDGVEAGQEKVTHDAVDGLDLVTRASMLISMRPRLSVDTSTSALEGGENAEARVEEGSVASTLSDLCSTPGRTEQGDVDSSPAADLLIHTPAESFTAALAIPDLVTKASEPLSPSEQEHIPSSHPTGLIDLEAPKMAALDLPPISMRLLNDSPIYPLATHRTNGLSSSDSQPSPALRDRKSLRDLFARTPSSHSQTNHGHILGMPSTAPGGLYGQRQGESPGSTSYGERLNFNVPAPFVRPTRSMTTDGRGMGPSVSRGKADNGIPANALSSAGGMARSRTESPHSGIRDRSNGIVSSPREAEGLYGRTAKAISGEAVDSDASNVSPGDAYAVLSPLSDSFRVDAHEARELRGLPHITTSTGIGSPNELGTSTIRPAVAAPSSISTPNITHSSLGAAKPTQATSTSRPKAKRGLGSFLKRAFSGRDEKVPRPEQRGANLQDQRRIPDSVVRGRPEKRLELERMDSWGAQLAEKFKAEHVERSMVLPDVSHGVTNVAVYEPMGSSPDVPDTPLTPVISVERPAEDKALPSPDGTVRPDQIPLPPSPDPAGEAEATELLASRQGDRAERDPQRTGAKDGQTRRMFDLSESDEEEDEDDDEAEVRTSEEILQPLTVRNQDVSGSASPSLEGVESLPVDIARNAADKATHFMAASPETRGRHPSAGVSPPSPSTYGGGSDSVPLSDAARYAQTVLTARVAASSPEPECLDGRRSRGPPSAMSNGRYRASSANAGGGLQRKNSRFRRSVYGLADSLAGRPTPDLVPLQRRTSLSPTMHTIGSISRETSQIMDPEEKKRAEDMFLM